MEWKTLKRWSCQESSCPLVKNDKKKKTLIQISAPTSTYKIEGRDKLCKKGRDLSFFFNIGKILLRKDVESPLMF